jgi:hypothetical protein
MQIVDYEQFRKNLAFPYTEKESKEDEATFEFLVDACAVLPSVYGAELDRLKMWDRISNGLQVLLSKVKSNHEIMDALLKFVCADTAKAVANTQIIDLFARQPSIDIQAMRREITTKGMYITVLARNKWQEEING